MKKNSSQTKLSPVEQEELALKKKKHIVVVFAIVGILLAGWLGFAIWDDATGGFGEKKIVTTNVNLDSIVDYVEGLSED